MGESERPDKLLLRWRLLEVREGTLDLQGHRTEQRVDLDTLQQLADTLNDDARRAEVALRCSKFAVIGTDFRAAESVARKAMALAERAGVAEVGLVAQRYVALALTFLGDAASARELAQNGLAAARAQGLRRVEGLFINALAIVADRQDDLLAMAEMSRQYLLIVRELGNRRLEAIALNNLGYACLHLGEHTQARSNLDESVRVARAVGHPRAESFARIGLSRLALRQGDNALALAHAQSALDIAMAVQERTLEGRGLCSLGDAELALGRHQAASDYFQRAHAVLHAIGEGIRYDAQAGLARAALANGDVTGAMQALEDLLAHLASGGRIADASYPRLIQLRCYQVLARAGDPRAGEVLASAHADLQARAAAISDATLRQSFLNNIPEHREIIAAFRSSAHSTMEPS
jgi:tetratricopeptide (TPR) repeat protein